MRPQASKYGLADRYHATSSRAASSRSLPLADRLIGTVANDASRAATIPSAMSMKALRRRLGTLARYALTNTPTASQMPEIGTSRSGSAGAIFALSGIPTAQLGASKQDLTAHGMGRANFVAGRQPEGRADAA